MFPVVSRKTVGFLLKKADKNSNNFNGKMVADQFAVLAILVAIFSAKMTVIIIL